MTSTTVARRAVTTDVKERPILFGAPMVLALLAARKTQTRRVVKDQPAALAGLYGDRYNHSAQWAFWLPDGRMDKPRTFACPYGDVGDRLWVRETWRTDSHLDTVRPAHIVDSEPVYFDATPPPWGTDRVGKVRQSIFMPRWASRITLEVTEVRVQRVQDLDETDARSEGAVYHDGRGVGHSGWRHDPDHGYVYSNARLSFFRLWDSINGKRPGCTWADNPWVWAITFSVIP